jgi:hypothetical protein
MDNGKSGAAVLALRFLDVLRWNRSKGRRALVVFLMASAALASSALEPRPNLV